MRSSLVQGGAGLPIKTACERVGDAPADLYGSEGITRSYADRRRYKLAADRYDQTRALAASCSKSLK